jgi:hypothetical protein
LAFEWVDVCRYVTGMAGNATNATDATDDNATYADATARNTGAGAGFGAWDAGDFPGDAGAAGAGDGAEAGAEAGEGAGAEAGDGSSGADRASSGDGGGADAETKAEL